ncbi:hypothetical protein BX616_009673 [Lobosporangium transversale]|uniref:Uncharacterized protein n=1 Tax=Lobosporangium transversale TaxID=64571 RepID=A0A1Y2GFI7_9FUNG|nr:hypothetical protein BCR41DRAFT_381660 [Lobosporangium transversale]KAF9913743.1 hypothetical protein BX616_009673 [Lobosporangium transversale]ORZ09380.1 hypothetical protein BCR41DRAFT_381660 [Lobosporangium transversale]|eukprot:XP_021878833.1 hypothetical protein BCR41DRAFT_381660 [Lobosporangium transversale]
MTSTPTPDQIPIEEQPVLEALVSIKHRLTAIKKDRSRFLKTSTVIALYDELCVQLQRLEEIRGAGNATIWGYKNNVNCILDDVFVILSLCFMAVGKTKESPATYVQLLTIKQCLTGLQESGVFAAEDLKQYEDRLKQLEDFIKVDEAKSSTPDIQTKILRRKLDFNNKLLKELQDAVKSISPELAPIHRRLVQLKIELATLASRSSSSWSSSEVHHIQEELREIESKREDGKFMDAEGNVVCGQAAVIGLLEDCYDDCHNLLATKEPVPQSLRDIFDRLEAIKSDLERLVLTQRWTLRETDLWQYEIQLSEISALRTNGKFVNRDGDVEEGQALLNFMLHKCYRLIYILLTASEPIAEALVPIHNQLLTVRRCLLEVKKWGGDFTVRDLYPYQMKLASMDNMRVDGKFLDKDNEIPEGQGICNSLLSECYDIMYELQDSVVDDASDKECDNEEENPGMELRGSKGLDVVV